MENWVSARTAGRGQNTQSVQSLLQLVGEDTKVFFNVQCTGVSEREKKAEKELLGNERA